MLHCRSAAKARKTPSAGEFFRSCLLPLQSSCVCWLHRQQSNKRHALVCVAINRNGISLPLRQTLFTFHVIRNPSAYTANGQASVTWRWHLVPSNGDFTDCLDYRLPTTDLWSKITQAYSAIGGAMRTRDITLFWVRHSKKREVASCLVFTDLAAFLGRQCDVFWLAQKLTTILKRW